MNSYPTPTNIASKIHRIHFPFLNNQRDIQNEKIIWYDHLEMNYLLLFLSTDLYSKGQQMVGD